MIPLLLALSCIPVDGPKLLARHFTSAAPEFQTLAPETDMGYYQQLAVNELLPPLAQTPLRTDSMISGLSLVLASDYLTIVARAMQAPFGLQDQLCMLNIDSLPQAEYHVLYSQKSPLTFAARRLLDLLRQHCQAYHWH